MTPLAQLLEAALFSAPRPLTVEELSTLDQEATLSDVRMALEQIREIAVWLGRAAERRAERFARGYLPSRPSCRRCRSRST